MFFEEQRAQVEAWLLEPRMYLLVLGLSLLSVILGVERVDRKYWIHTVTDFGYGLMSALLYLPIIAICLAVVKSLIDTWLPWINLGLADTLPAAFAFLFVVV